MIKISFDKEVRAKRRRARKARNREIGFRQRSELPTKTLVPLWARPICNCCDFWQQGEGEANMTSVDTYV